MQDEPISQLPSVNSVKPTDLIPVVASGTTSNIIVSRFGGSLPTVTSRTVTSTVGPSGSVADFICTGSHDGAQILAAINSLPAQGGKVLIRNSATPYDFSAIADRLFILASNITIEGESYGGVILQANASLFPGGSNAQGQYGILSIGRNQSSLISNITLRNLIINCNNQLKTGAVQIDGGSGMSGSIGLQNVLLENVTVENACQNSSDPLTAGAFIASGTNQAIGDRGYVDRVTFRRCNFGPSQERILYFQGTNITNIILSECYVHDCQASGGYIQDYGTSITNSDWLIEKTRFERNMITTQSFSQAHFRDNSQVGVNNFTVDNCYFGPTQNPSTTQDYCLTPYAAVNTRITNNIFDRIGAGISIGASISANYTKLFSLNRILIADNVFYQARTCFDPDSTLFMNLRGNIFYQVQQNPVFAPYSEHYPTNIEDNIFYDCHTNDPGASNSNTRSILRLNGDGFVVRNNKFIDDRSLPNPTASLTLSQVSGGSLSSRTYFVEYTFVNATGETLGSSEQSLTISANNLFKVTYSNSKYPYGATSINIYVSTTTNTETLQSSISLPSKTMSWTEPSTGLISGSALPGSNTTTNLTAYGIYELSGGGGENFANIYEGNKFYGIPTGNEIVTSSSYFRISKGNVTNPTLTAGGDVLLADTSIFTNSLKVTTGTNTSIGTGILSSGTVTISTTVVTSSSLIFITPTSKDANSGSLSIGTIVAGTSFVVNSTNASDDNTFNWLVIN